MAAMSSVAMPGTVLDAKYVLHAALGAGRFGTVYRATHIALQKPVAVKLLHPGERLAGGDFEQFRVEAEALGRLSHRHIVGVIDFGVDPRGVGTPYLVMELVEGPTLDEICAREGPVDLSRAWPWIRQVAMALDHAHASGVAHGDLSARNVVLTGTGDQLVAKVIDFGLARLVAVDTTDVPASRDGEAGAEGLGFRVAGTPEYLAPERLRGEAPSASADTYALAVLAYRVLTGRHPFEGDPREVMRQHLASLARPASAAHPGLPAAVDHALADGLAKSARDRPPVALAFADRIGDAARTLARQRWRRAEAPRRFALALGLAAALASLGPSIGRVAVVARLDGAIQDAQFALAPAVAPDPRLLLVSLDDETLATDATPLTSRAGEFARVVGGALDQGAAVVAVDLLLPEAWAGDPALGDLLLTQAPRLVFGMASDGVSVVGPEMVDPLVAVALGPEVTSDLFALVTHTPSADGVVRHARRVVTDRAGRSRATLAGRIAALAGDAESVVNRPLVVPVDYRLDATRLDRMGWRRFADAVASGVRLDGRLMIVGAEFAGSGDRHRAPAPGQLSVERSGLALQGLVASTMLQARGLTEVAGAGAWIATAALLAVSLLALLWAKSVATAVGLAGGTLVAGLLLSQVALRSGYLLPMGAAVASWVGAAGVALACRARWPAPPE